MVAGCYETVFPRGPDLCPVKGKSIPFRKIKYKMYRVLLAENNIQIFFGFSPWIFLSLSGSIWKVNCFF